MPSTIAAETSLSGAVLIAVVVLAVVELALIVVSLVDLTRRPAVLGGRKWVWAVVILLFNLIGPIVYLAVGRMPAQASDDAPRPEGGTRDRATATADLLYGPGGDPQRPSGDPPRRDRDTAGPPPPPS